MILQSVMMICSLYTFSLGLLERFDGDKESALQNFDKAEKFLQQAEGNEFFSYRIFRRERMKLLRTWESLKDMSMRK